MARHDDGDDADDIDRRSSKPLGVRVALMEQDMKYAKRNLENLDEKMDGVVAIINKAQGKIAGLMLAGTIAGAMLSQLIGHVLK